MTLQDFRKLQQIGLSILESECKDKFHGTAHSLDVIEIVDKLLEMEGLSQCEYVRQVLHTCAYWHDIGRLSINKGHEEVSAMMLLQEIGNMQTDMSDSRLMSNIIKGHAINSEPENNLLQDIFRDADKIAYFGPRRVETCKEGFEHEFVKCIGYIKDDEHTLLRRNSAKELFKDYYKYFINKI